MSHPPVTAHTNTLVLMITIVRFQEETAEVAMANTKLVNVCLVTLGTQHLELAPALHLAVLHPAPEDHLQEALITIYTTAMDISLSALKLPIWISILPWKMLIITTFPITDAYLGMTQTQKHNNTFFVTIKKDDYRPNVNYKLYIKI